MTKSSDNPDATDPTRPLVTSRRNFLTAAASVTGAQLLVGCAAAADASAPSNAGVRAVQFDELPDVLIQDAVHKVAYLIPAKKLAEYIIKPEDLMKMGPEVVTFVIPDDEILHVIPPFSACESDTPSVHVQYPRGAASYLLTFEQLKAFQIEQPKDPTGYGISFILPIGLQFIEQLPAIMTAPLQSGEAALVGRKPNDPKARLR
jgi:hypothetical protein